MFGLDDIVNVGMKVLDKVIPDPAAKAAAVAQLETIKQNGELAQLQADMNEQNNVSDRWKADMASDSKLSKNIRPMTLIYILTAFILMAVLDGFGFHIAEAYVTLLGQWGIVVMTAYFGGRTLEKVLKK